MGGIQLWVENIPALTLFSILVVLQICRKLPLMLYFCMKVVKVIKVLLSLSKKHESFSMPTFLKSGEKIDDLFTRIN